MQGKLIAKGFPAAGVNPTPSPVALYGRITGGGFLPVTGQNGFAVSVPVGFIWKLVSFQFDYNAVDILAAGLDVRRWKLTISHGVFPAAVVVEIAAKSVQINGQTVRYTFSIDVQDGEDIILLTSGLKGTRTRIPSVYLDDNSVFAVFCQGVGVNDTISNATFIVQEWDA